MKSKVFVLALTVATVAGLTGCPETKVPRDFGMRPLKLKAEEWNGVWRDPTDAEGMTFTVTDAAKGEFTITFAAQDKKEPEVMMAVVNELNGGDKEQKLAFLVHFDKDGDAHGDFNLIRRPEKGVFQAWNPKHDAIEAAIKSGELKGELTKVPKTKDEEEHNHTRLAADHANYVKLLEPRFWKWLEPETFVKQAAK